MLCLSLLLPTSLYAFPTQNVRIVTNLPVGSAPDIFVRKLSTRLESHWKVPVIVENRPGGAGLVALDYFLRLPNDGHNIMFGDFGFWITTPILYDKEQLYQQMRPLTIAIKNPWVIVVPTNIKTLNDLKAKLQENPRFGSWGVGSGGHMCGQELSALFQIQTTHIPYKEYGNWFTDTSNGLLSFGCTSIGSSESWVSAGKLNLIATATNQRLTFNPNLQTIKEITGKHFETGEAWLAFATHVKVDDSKAIKLEQDLRTLTKSPEILSVIESIKSWPVVTTSSEMTKQRQSTLEQHQVLIKKFNITVN